MNTLKSYQVNENQLEQVAREATAAHPRWKFALGSEKDQKGNSHLVLIGCEVTLPHSYVILSTRDATTGKYFFEGVTYSFGYEEWVSPRSQIAGSLDEIITEIDRRAAYLTEKDGDISMNPVTKHALKVMCNHFQAKRVQ